MMLVLGVILFLDLLGGESPAKERITQSHNLFFIFWVLILGLTISIISIIVMLKFFSAVSGFDMPMEFSIVYLN